MATPRLRASEEASNDPLVIAGRAYRSRMLVGSGKYKDFATMQAAIAASGAEIVTVALRRLGLFSSSPGPQAEGEEGRGPSLLAWLKEKNYTLLPNSAGCYTAEEAVRTLRLAREAGGWKLVKLEVIGDATTLYPDVPETLRAAATLVADGFEVMAYANDDPVAARRLEDVGCVAVMPLAAPIGSGLGVQNPLNIRRIVEQARIPILVDAGVGTASDAAVAMELGCDAVLMNTALAEARDPAMMAQAMRRAVEAGRLAYRAGRMPKRASASASSPEEGNIHA